MDRVFRIVFMLFCELIGLAYMPLKTDCTEVASAPTNAPGRRFIMFWLPERLLALWIA